MPSYRLINAAGEVVRVRTLDHDVAQVLNAELTDGSEWVRGLSTAGRPPVGTITRILRTLSTEGFTSESVNEIEDWLNQQVKIAQRDRAETYTLRDKFSAFMKQQPPEIRKLVGKFIGKQVGHGLDAGLRLGLSGRLTVDGEARWHQFVTCRHAYDVRAQPFVLITNFDPNQTRVIAGYCPSCLAYKNRATPPQAPAPAPADTGI